MPVTKVELGRTPDGRRLEVSLELPADAGTVWDLFADTRRWPEWGPSVSQVNADERYVREGMAGQVKVLGAAWVPFEITTATDRRWTWNVAGIPATGHRVETVGPGRSRAVFELSPLAAGYVPVCQRALKRIEALVESDDGDDEDDGGVRIEIS